MKIYTVGWDLDGSYDLDGSLDELFTLKTFDPLQIKNGEIIPYRVIDKYGKIKKNISLIWIQIIFLQF